MALFVGHTTALLFWRAVGEGRLPMPTPAGNVTLASSTSARRRITGIDLTPVGLQPAATGIASAATNRPATLDVLVDTPGKAHTSRGIRPHVMTCPLPADAFYRVSDDICVTSPEISFLHGCSTGHDLPNVELAFELCGRYSIAPRAPGGIAAHDPLTSTDAIRATLGRMPGAMKRRVALRAVAAAANGMRSPKETELYVMLTTPVARGGYGLPTPEVNPSIAITGDATRLTDDRRYEADLLYRDAKTIVEYDGRAYHERLDALERDKSRRSVLAAMGYAVIVVTADDLVSEHALNQKAAQVAAAIGHTLQVPDDVAVLNRTALFTWLFVGTHAHLPFGFGY